MQLLVSRVVKILLHIFSTIVLMYGIFLVVCGLLIVFDMRSFSSFIQSRALWLPYLITFSGIMMVVLTVFSFWATERKNYKVLFFISAVVVLLIEVAIVIWVSANDSTYTKQLRKSLDNHITKYSSTQKPAPLDLLQRKLLCCGVQGPNDWNKFINRNEVPGSCCRPAPLKAGTFCVNSPGNVHQQGCLSVLSKRFSDHWSVISLLATLAAFAQLILLLLSTSMAFLVKWAKVARERE